MRTPHRTLTAEERAFIEERVSGFHTFLVEKMKWPVQNIEEEVKRCRASLWREALHDPDRFFGQPDDEAEDLTAA